MINHSIQFVEDGTDYSMWCQFSGSTSSSTNLSITAEFLMVQTEATPSSAHHWESNFCIFARNWRACNQVLLGQSSDNCTSNMKKTIEI